MKIEHFGGSSEKPFLTEKTMPKYYTMKECFDECGNDDIPFIKDEWNDPGDIQLTKANLLNNNLFGRLTWKIVLSDKWQIKRAESEVLSIDDIVEDTAKIGAIRHFETITHPKEALQICAKKADKNGQLREWLRPEQVELRKSLEKVVEYYDKYKNANQQMIMISFDPHIIKRIYEAVIDIKPPINS